MSGKSACHIALIGNPNVGKSSVFNRLTGLRQKVGNFPGVTVDKKTGSIELPLSGTVEVVDLPGLYSLYPTSEDEKVVIDSLLQQDTSKLPKAIVFVADANDLERNLLLCTQLMDTGIPLVLVLNMLDTAEKAGLSIQTDRLSNQLNIAVVALNGRTGEGVEALKKAIDQQLHNPFITAIQYPFSDAERKTAEQVGNLLGEQHLYTALLIAHHFRRLRFLTPDQKEAIMEIVTMHGFNAPSVQLDEMMTRFKKIAPIVQQSVSRKPVQNGSKSTRFDQLATHPVWGLVLFTGLMILVFQSIFAWSEWPMTQIETAFGWMAGFISEHLPDVWISRLLSEGVIAGMSGVLVFIPQIAVLFFLISLLEESGYMARVVYLLDNLMRRFGLNGRSVVALISGGACAVPAIMSTRTIGNWKERLLTILVTPLISCSARIPVFTILIALTIPSIKIGGWLNVQGLVFLGLYITGTVAALLSAWVFSKLIKTEEPGFLIMELPRYQMPQWKNVFLTVYEKVKTFVLEAGKIILLVSIILWFMASYGPPGAMEKAEKEAKAAYSLSDEIPYEQLEASYKLEASFAGKLGKIMEPVIEPLGYDWKIGIALITSFAAREVFVGTMATIYAVGDSNDELLLRERMKNAKHPDSGKPVFTLAAAVSLMIFYLFAMQCMSTLAVVRRETKSWKWPAIQFAYMTLLAYVGSFLAYTILS